MHVLFSLAVQYIIKSSENLLVLKDEFDKATSVNSSDLTPQEAGSTETFKFKPENLRIENGTIIYIAMRAVDNDSLTSDISNIAKATWYIPPKASEPSDGGGSSGGGSSDGGSSGGVNVTLIVAIVAGCVVVVCIIVSSSVCIVQKQRRRNPAIRI